ncbi:MAG TPA: hypothetical protein VJK51_00170 [Candidatus Nanoarchaeia archaeon]|nr:hypothetical protein [Candidatus Nanoarchaeia archaeon]
MNEVAISLLSGLIGALLGSISTILYTEYRDKKEEKRRIAKEKLEKVYAPLVALKKKIDLVNKNDNGFLFPSNPMENELVEKIMFNHYYLIDEDLRDYIPLLNSQLRNDPTNQMKFPEMMEKIRKHYKENKKILGLK